MARRPDVRPHEPTSQGIMTPDEISQLRISLSRLSLDAVRQAYHTAYARCRMVNDRVPSARSIQELVQVWKHLWRRR